MKTAGSLELKTIIYLKEKRIDCILMSEAGDGIRKYSLFKDEEPFFSIQDWSNKAGNSVSHHSEKIEMHFPAERTTFELIFQTYDSPLWRKKINLDSSDDSTEFRLLVVRYEDGSHDLKLKHGPTGAQAFFIGEEVQVDNQKNDKPQQQQTINSPAVEEHQSDGVNVLVPMSDDQIRQDNEESPTNVIERNVTKTAQQSNLGSDNDSTIEKNLNERINRFFNKISNELFKEIDSKFERRLESLGDTENELKRWFSESNIKSLLQRLNDIQRDQDTRQENQEKRYRGMIETFTGKLDKLSDETETKLQSQDKRLKTDLAALEENLVKKIADCLPDQSLIENRLNEKLETLNGELIALKEKIDGISGSVSDLTSDLNRQLDERLNGIREKLETQTLEISDKLMSVQDKLRAIGETTKELENDSALDPEVILSKFAERFSRVAHEVYYESPEKDDHSAFNEKYNDRILALQEKYFQKVEEVKNRTREFISTIKEKLPESDQITRICNTLQTTADSDFSIIDPSEKAAAGNLSSLTFKSWSAYLKGKLNISKSDRSFSLVRCFQDYLHYLDEEFQSWLKSYFSGEEDLEKTIEKKERMLENNYIQFLKMKILPALEAADKLLLQLEQNNQISADNHIYILEKIDELAAACELIPVNVDIPFDPDLHDAVGSEVSQKPKNSILRLIQSGWSYNDQILLKAQVIISEAQNKQGA